MSIAKINEISAERYGKQINGLGPISAMWLAEYILLTTNKNVYKTISQHRSRYGLSTTLPDPGTELFRLI